MLAIEAISKAVDRFPRSNKRSARDLARRLGWFSVAIGALEVAAPRGLSRFLGLRGGETLISFFGMREIATGVAILSSRNPEPFVWGRVAGDGLDLAALTAALLASRRKPLAGLALGSVAAITMIDIICAQTLTSDAERKRGRIPDYGTRTGLPKGPRQMRGAARKDFRTPVDMQVTPQPQPASLP